MDVRMAGPGDGVALAGLQWRWRVEELGGTGMDWPAFAAAFTTWLEDHRTSHLAWIATDGVPFGMAWLHVVERIPGPVVWTRLAGAVQSVYVAAEHRNKGAGGALMDALVSEGRRMGLDYLSVHPSERSFSFYRRLGFGDTGRTLELRPLG